MANKKQAGVKKEKVIEYEYYIKEPYCQKEALVTAMKVPMFSDASGEPYPVNLLGEDYHWFREATPFDPGVDKIARGVTQEELKELYEKPEIYGKWKYMIGKREKK